MTNELNNLTTTDEQCADEMFDLEASPIPEIELPKHKVFLEVINERKENLFNDNFLVEVVAPKFYLKKNLSEINFEQKSGMIVVMEHAPDVIKNVFKACKQNVVCKLKMAVEDEIYSIWELKNANIVAVNLGVLTKGAINQKRDSFVECEIEFDELIVDGESLY